MKQSLNPFFYANNPQLLAYEKAWIDYIKDGLQPLESVIPRVIFDSWERCKVMGLDPLFRGQNKLLDEEEIKTRNQISRGVLSIAKKYMKTVYDIINDDDVSVDFTDKDGYLIHSLCSHSVNDLVRLTRLGLGCNMNEEKIGTNAVALAIKSKRPIQTTGAQFYIQKYHAWTISAAPILDSAENVLGVISIGGNYESINKHTLGVVSAAADAVENEIRIQNINEQLESNMQQRTELLNMVTDGIVYAEDGIIKQVNQEMCKLMGVKEKRLIGKKLSEAIKTTPDIQKIIESEGRNYDNREIVLKGEKDLIKCIYDVRVIKEEQYNVQLVLMTRVDEIRSLADSIRNVAEFTFDDIVFSSQIMREKVEMAKTAAKFGSRILIQGESGTGKEIIAQAIHNESTRKYNSFVAIDCGAIPRELFESEMFGYVGGAFTGARAHGKIGLLELADKGTVFLDEVGNMPIEMQAKLLRVLQDGYLTKVGSVEKKEIDVRVICQSI